MARISRKELKHDEIQEAAFDLGHWIERHWQSVALAVGGAAVVVAAVAIFFWWSGNQRAEREARLAEAQRLYGVAAEAGFVNVDDVSAALYAFEDLAAKTGNTSVGRLARYYRAATLAHLHRDSEAIEVLEALTAGSGGSTTVRGQAELLLVMLYGRSGETQKATELLESAIDSPGALAPEQALIELGRIRFEQGDVEGAKQAWQRVVDDFPQTAAVSEARQLLD